MKQKFEHLAKPLRMGSVTAKNRIWMAPMHSRLCTIEGEVTQLLIDHYVARARGGAGLILQEATAIDSRHMLVPEIGIDDDKFCSGLHKLVEAVHMYDVPILAQLHHAGMFGTDPVGPSDVACFSIGGQYYIQPRALTMSEIEEVRDRFIDCAVRAQTVEYDGIELHGSTAYLLEQFFSPHSNKRTDKYGGSLEGRMLLPLEIVRGIREKCGPDFVLAYTIVEDDLLPDGINLEDAIIFAKRLEEAGVSFIDFQATGTYETYHWETSRGVCLRQKRGKFDQIEPFKGKVNIPLVARSLGQYNPAVWEENIKNGVVEAVASARPTLADPDIFNKILEGRYEDVRLCIRDNYCIESGVAREWNIGCAVNPEMGRGERRIERARESKKVLVIGGGPGGLEAARVAALRGHSVTLVEKAESLGGTVKTYARAIGKGAVKAFISWARRQCQKLGVTIELNTEATPELVEKLNPDAVIVATGATLTIPPIPGADKSHVVKADNVLLDRATLGKKVVVVGEGRLGVETADYIIEKGLAEDVTIIGRTPEIGGDMTPMERGYMLHNVVPKIGVKFIPFANVEEVTDTGLVIIDKAWRKQELPADTVVYAESYVPNRAIYEVLKGKASQLYIIGDAIKPRKIVTATTEGAHFAKEI